MAFLLAACLLPLRAPAADDLAAAADQLRTDELGLWIGLAGDQDRPDCTKETALDVPLYLRLRDVARLSALADSNLVNGALTLKLGHESYTTWGPLELGFDATQRVVRIAGDRLKTLTATSPTELTKPEVDGRIVLELRPAPNQLLILRRATWTQSNGEEVDLRRSIPGKFQSPVGLRLSFFAL